MTSEQFTKQVTELQALYQAKIQAAAAQGRAGEIESLVAELQTKVQALSDQLQASLSQAPESAPTIGSSAGQPRASEAPVFARLLSQLDLDHLAHPSDLAFFRKLPSNTTLVSLIEKIEATGRRARAHRGLLTDAMRLTPNVSKELHSIVERCREILDVRAPSELYVVADREFNAGVLPSVDGRISIYFTSGLLEAFNAQELAFVVGHELGHAIFGHVNVPKERIIADHGVEISPKEVLSLRSWGRAAELSADRCGLLCAQDYGAACQAFFKLSSGITSPQFKFSVEDYMGQYQELEKYLRESKSEDMIEFYSTHPLNPVRLKALELFRRSEVYFQLTRSAAEISPLSKAQMETEINKFMELLEPNYLESTSPIGANVREFVFLTGFMVAMSDGAMDVTELNQLAQLIESADAEQRVHAVLALPPQQVIDQIVIHAQKICFEVPLVARLGIVRDVFSIACANGVLTDSEIAEMQKVASVLGINSLFVEDLVRSAGPADEVQNDDEESEAA